MKYFFSLLMVLVIFCSNVSAEELYEYKEDVSNYKEPVYEDPTGVQVKFNDDGTVRAILASGESELRFGDRRDIRQAIKKATMRAKSEISKFLKESISSSDIVNDMEKVASKMDNSGNSTATRETIESQIEILENSSHALLSGIVTLKQDVNKKEKFVLVV